MIAQSTAVTVALLVLAAPVRAHSPIEGVGDFYAGFLHPLLVPAHLLCILTFGLLIGRQGVQRVQLAVVVYFVALLVGLTGAAFAMATPPELLLLGLAALSGVLLAVGATLPPVPLAVLGAAAGVTVGLDSAQQELSGSGLLAALLGTGLGASVAVLYLFVFAEWFSRHAWQRVGLRVLGSWAAAAALLVGALQLSV